MVCLHIGLVGFEDDCREKIFDSTLFLHGYHSLDHKSGGLCRDPTPAWRFRLQHGVRNDAAGHGRNLPTSDSPAT